MTPADTPCDFCGALYGPRTVFGCPSFTMRAVRADGKLLIFRPDAPAGMATAFMSTGEAVGGVFDPAVLAGAEITGEHRYRGNWEACADCAPLVIAGRWDDLMDRVPAGPERTASRGIWALFASVATGDHWPAPRRA